MSDAVPVPTSNVTPRKYCSVIFELYQVRSNDNLFCMNAHCVPISNDLFFSGFSSRPGTVVTGVLLGGLATPPLNVYNGKVLNEAMSLPTCAYEMRSLAKLTPAGISINWLSIALTPAEK